MKHAPNCTSLGWNIALVLFAVSFTPLFTGCNQVQLSQADSVPAVTLSANPKSIVAGGSSTLTMTAANATQLRLTGSDGSSYSIGAAGGTQRVSPAKTTTYTLAATGNAGTASVSTTVSVAANPAPAVTIVANPSSIGLHGSSILTVTATNASQVTVIGTDGSSDTSPADRWNRGRKPDCDHHLYGNCNRGRRDGEGNRGGHRCLESIAVRHHRRGPRFNSIG